MKRSEKDKVFDMLETVISGLENELGRNASSPEIMIRSALISGVYVGGAAAEVSDPDSFIPPAGQPIASTAHEVLREITN